MEKKIYKVKPSTRKKMSKAHVGKHHSPETIAKIRARKIELDQERAKLVKLGMEPFHHSEATKAKLRRIALKQKRRHKLTKAEKAKGNATMKDIAANKRLTKNLAKHNWEV